MTKRVAWGCNTNELNAAYAANRYARIKGAAAISTVMGVGELSAINDIAGSYAEMLPVIHLVSYPATEFVDKKINIHHSFGNGDYNTFFNIASMLAIASTKLTMENATQEVDRVIQTAYISKRPGYISFPLDLIFAKVEVPNSILPLDLSPKKNSEILQKAALYHTINTIQKAKNPIVIIDPPVIRFNLTAEVNEFIAKSGFLAFATPMGKGAVDLDLPNYRGVYNGGISLPQVLAEYDEADLVIEIGSIPCDFNSGGFTTKQTKSNIITINFDQTTVHHTNYKNETEQTITEDTTTTSIIPQKYFWSTIPKYLSHNSIIVTEHGTALTGAQNLHALGAPSYLSQHLWGSIGYNVGATLGAAMAARDQTVYLFVGDGSFQLTAQEVSDFIRQGIIPVIFLINNNGYLVERLIRGPQRKYNNIQIWQYSKSLEYFGGHIKANSVGLDKHSSIIGVEAKLSTRQGLEKVMTKVNGEPNKTHFIEVIFSAFDSPNELTFLCSKVKRRMDQMTAD